ncbi:MAG: RIP metalloprotease RseP [Candidatus Kapabacteria bacterium]|nr:RIP metalloprotease RseP [Ignavibacteriota bacterium]MCW5885733.1 RIP metalloprotease RseP [Candidatus Kapabacteria bacterium]
MELISSIIYFIIVIGILVAIHEFGHFIAARMTGMRAEVFSVGMGKRLFGWNKINGFTFGKLAEDIELGNHTDYRIAVFPIGGYVKISGMIDESFDTDFQGNEPKPYEFRSKNSFQKIFVLSAGVIMNVLLAIVVFGSIAFFEGRSEFATTTIGKVEPGSVSSEIGLKAGDRILSVNNSAVTTWTDFLDKITLKEFGNQLEIKAQRNNNEILLNADGNKIIKALSKKKSIGLTPGGISIVVEDVIKESPASSLGLVKGDTILRIDGAEVSTLTGMQDNLKGKISTPVYLEWKRGSKILSDTLTTSDKGMIGIQMGFGPVTTVSYSFFQSVVIGFEESYNSFMLLIKSLRQIFIGNLSFKETIGGPIMIMDMAGEQASRGVTSFLNFLALLSISLAFMNILPFPALDGGHIVFAAIEGIIRKEVPVKIKLAFQQGGIIILLLFMVFVLFNDVTRILK